jgi:hypothetical protein
MKKQAFACEYAKACFYYFGKILLDKNIARVIVVIEQRNLSKEDL